MSREEQDNCFSFIVLIIAIVILLAAIQEAKGR